MGAFIWIAEMELKTLAWGYTAESLWWGHWGKMEKMGFCCQSLGNPLLMEWEKAAEDSKSKGGEEGISHRWVWVNSYKDNELCLCACSCESKIDWNKWSRARRPPVKHHYKQLQKYYAFGISRNAEGAEQIISTKHTSHTGTQPLTLGHNNHTQVWCGSVVSSLDIVLFNFAFHAFCFASR